VDILQKKRPKNFIYDTNTKNISFIQTMLDLKKLNIKNNAFFLKLYDTKLIGVDPYDPGLSDELVIRIINECIRNPWYFLREVKRIPVGSNMKGIPYILNRANLASTWCFIHNIDGYTTIPRQIGKTDSSIAMIDWAEQFATSSSEFAFFNLKGDRAAANLNKLRVQRSLLPSYLQIKKFNEDGKVEKGKDNTYTITNPATKNTLTAFSSATSKESAETRGRGCTQPIQYFDEFEFTPHIYTIMTAAGPAFVSASRTARENKSMYGRIFTSTPGDLDSAPGMQAANVLEGTCRFSEKFYDWSLAEVKEYISTNSSNGIVYIEFTYTQLGKDEEWFLENCKSLNNDPAKIKRELLLQRFHGSKESPYDQEALNIISESRGTIIEELFISKLFKFDIYEELDPTRIYFVGVDVANGYGEDNSAVTIFDPYLLRPVAEFKCPYISVTQFKQLLFVLVKKFIPKAILAIERNHNGEAILAMLRSTEISHRLYWDNSKDIVASNVDEKLDNQGFLKKEAMKRKLYGISTNPASRPRMFALLDTWIRENKDKFVTNNIIDDLLKLVRTKTGKIEAASGFHDDSIMSFLMCLYLYYYGNNLMRYGYERGLTSTEILSKHIKDSNIDVYDYLSDTDKEFFSSQYKEIELYKQIEEDKYREIAESDLEIDLADDKEFLADYIERTKSEIKNIDPYEYKLRKEMEMNMKSARFTSSDTTSHGGVAKITTVDESEDSYDSDDLSWFDELI
jgi:hypothetical protein